MIIYKPYRQIYWLLLLLVLFLYDTFHMYEWHTRYVQFVCCFHVALLAPATRYCLHVCYSFVVLNKYIVVSIHTTLHVVALFLIYACFSLFNLSNLKFVTHNFRICMLHSRPHDKGTDAMYIV